MANTYVNKVQLADGTSLIDISDTTATAADVLNSKYFYTASGQKVQGTGTGGGSVTQDQDGYIVLPATGGGGGGGQYDWLGANTEYIGSVSKTFNLSSDTSYDSWTATTSQTTILAAPSVSDYEITIDCNNYDYTIMQIAKCVPAYSQGATMVNTPEAYVRVEYIGVGFFGDNYAEVSTGNFTSVTSNNYFQKICLFYYGSIRMSMGTTSYGPMYVSNPSISVAATNGVGSVNVKRSAIYARCSTTYFATDRASEIDSQNTNMTIEWRAYRTPKTFITTTREIVSSVFND